MGGGWGVCDIPEAQNGLPPTARFKCGMMFYQSKKREHSPYVYQNTQRLTASRSLDLSFLSIGCSFWVAFRTWRLICPLITQTLLETNLGRLQVELYKEIKKNGASRSLRSALSRFADMCHLIRPQKCRCVVGGSQGAFPTMVLYALSFVIRPQKCRCVVCG